MNKILAVLCSRQCIIYLFSLLLPLELVAANVTYHSRIVGLSASLTSQAQQVLQNAATTQLSTPTQLPIVASQDTATLHTFMQTKGYFHARVENLIQAQDSAWLMTYYVTPGPATKIVKMHIQITGPGKANARLQKRITNNRLKPGKCFRQDRYERLKNRLVTTAVMQGYLDAQFTQHAVSINRTLNQAKIELVLATGPRYTIQHTQFTQHGFQFSPDFLKRFIPYSPQAIYRYQAQAQLQQNLEASNYFDAVSVHSTRNNQTHQVDIQAQVSAKKSQQYTFGMGYGTETGPRDLLGWKLRHITADGQRLTARVEFSKLYVNFGVSYILPGKDPLTDYTSLNAGQAYSDIIPYLSLETALGINWTRQLAHWRWNLGVHQMFIRYTIEPGHDQFVRYLIPDFFLSYQHFQKQGYWSNGFSILNDLSGTLQNPLSSQSFMRNTTQLRISYSLSHNNRLFSRLCFGALATHDLNTLSPTLRYYAGGVNNVRGYDFKSLSPTHNGYLSGGHYFFLVGLNFEHHITGNWSGLVFYNVGNAFNTFQDVDGAQGAGLGISWRSQMGPVQLFLSHPLFHRGQHSWRLNFSIGMDLG